ncbi:ATP-binding cassette domain-containing protein [Natronosporangium hydrolyticum]|uniref:ATP-binding cassette domain-containing protein n=1 Tax=Natronosporangium hydrolyticum TaxID=2811111 RepID=A0A895YL62_9ACTN|nr:ATP-binding cassette domain-containing protein [Natronosporangium hydrolyticum]QSB15406.1 ATP-binding cassette domain-containing protein [Natronosporangium hydrolyticum]
MISLRHLTKRYGDTTAVADLSLEIRAGAVTGFLGPNGAGKSTTMRVIVGVDHPTEGSATIGGERYTDLRYPLHVVGALLDARAVHPGRSGRNHLLAMARSNGIGRRRVDEVLELVGLSAAAGRRAGGYSLGMGQRLGIAGALLGDPPVLLFDEPVNGLDPDGVLWIRQLTRRLADEGRTVLVSSHLMSELQLMADQLVVLGRGRLLADAPLAEVIAGATPVVTQVRCADAGGAELLGQRLASHGYHVERPEPALLRVANAATAAVGDLAHQAGVAVHELTAQTASLEEAYLRLTDGSVEYAAAGSPAGRSAQ